MFLTLFFLSLFSLFYLFELVSFEELDLFDDESDNDRSGSGYTVTCAFSFCSVKSVGCVGKYVGCFCGVGSSVFVFTDLRSIGEVVLLVVFVPRGVESKVVDS